MTKKNQLQYDIPSELMSKAKILAGELAWSADDALEVITSLVSSGLTVVGVELWQEIDGSPKWIASSDYECDSESDWSQYVDQCSKASMSFINRFREEPGALFNLTWVREDDLKSIFA